MLEILPPPVYIYKLRRAASEPRPLCHSFERVSQVVGAVHGNESLV